MESASVIVRKLFVCVDDRVSDFSEFHHSQQHTRHHSDDTERKQELEKGTGRIPRDDRDYMNAEEPSRKLQLS